MESYNLIIVGAGPAGLAAAISAKSRGMDRILVIERMEAPGGIPLQCFHTGFGKRRYGTELKGTVYADRLLGEVSKEIELWTNAFVLAISRDGTVTVSGTGGLCKCSAGAVILATGCRERPIGSLPVYGTRPSGIFTAGSVQRMINLKGYRVGSRVVVLGSGDVGMIVSHHLSEHGAQVIAVLEKEQKLGGLVRNKHRYLDAHAIPVILGSTVTQLYGERRLEAVQVCHVDKEGKPLPACGYRLACDTLVTSVGLVPELELMEDLGAAFCRQATGVGTSLPWLFVCGNARRVHSLVDTVEQDGVQASIAACEYLSGLIKNG